MDKLLIFPWENGEEPYFTNEEGFSWYVDESLTKWCSVFLNGLPPLDAVCFIVTKMVDDEITPISRLLLDKKTSQVLGEHKSVEEMGAKIDALRFAFDE